MMNQHSNKGIGSANAVFNLNNVKTSVKTDKQSQVRFAVEDSSIESAGVRCGGNSKYAGLTTATNIV